jgi:transcriptional regulator GlxA family with amidase domain
LERIFRAESSAAGPLRLARIYLGILDYLLEVISLAQREPVRALSPAIAHVVEYIEKHLEDALSVEVLAREADLSVPRFKARFRSETGFPPAEFVLRRRIEHASRLLARSSSTVLDVAMASGFCSSQYFASAFRRITGMTPSLFRERLTSADSV